MGPVTAATYAIGAGVAVPGVTTAAEATTKGHGESPDGGGPELDMEILAAVVEIDRVQVAAARSRQGGPLEMVTRAGRP
jgi:NaMN:DMB phosphoribosyltransferase